jgi:N-acetylmuramoyl-L-alanine amidase
VDRGIKEKKEYATLGSMPAIEVEVVTITNWVEEGLLRSPTMHKKAAEGIFNGVKNYLAGSVCEQEVLA